MNSSTNCESCQAVDINRVNYDKCKASCFAYHIFPYALQ